MCTEVRLNGTSYVIYRNRILGLLRRGRCPVKPAGVLGILFLATP